MTKTNVLVTAVPVSDMLVKAPGHPDHVVMIRDTDNDGEWLPISQISRIHDGWEIPSGLVYGQLIGAALDQARRFLVHDSRSTFEYANVALTFEADAR